MSLCKYTLFHATLTCEIEIKQIAVVINYESSCYLPRQILDSYRQSSLHGHHSSHSAEFKHIVHS